MIIGRTFWPGAQFISRGVTNQIIPAPNTAATVITPNNVSKPLSTPPLPPPPPLSFTSDAGLSRIRVMPKSEGEMNI